MVDFLEQAARDPQVLAIKQTLYRTGGDPRIVGALMNAVRQRANKSRPWWNCARGLTRPTTSNGAASLKKRASMSSMGWSATRSMARCALVVRPEAGRIRRYVHLATGNYNPSTARLYTDLGLLTCRPDFGEDATNLFNLLTGICQFQGDAEAAGRAVRLARPLAAIDPARGGKRRRGLPARIIAKMNSLRGPRDDRSALPRVPGRRED